MKSTVGLIGLGTMGVPMAERLLDREYPLLVWNRSAAKADELVIQGARRAESPRQLGELCDVVITILSDGPAVEEVALGEGGLAAGLAAGKVHCDMSTIGTRTVKRVAVQYAEKGIRFLHAPVLGNRRHAATGALLIFAGGSSEAYQTAKPVLDALGKKTWRWDDPEKATCAKLACNLLLGGMMEVFCESLVFAAKAGISPRDLLDILNSSALASPMISAKGQTILARDFAPSFFLQHMNKDLTLVIDHSRRIGVSLPGTSAMRSVYYNAVQKQMTQLDYSAVIQILEENSGVKVQA